MRIFVFLFLIAILLTSLSFSQSTIGLPQQPVAPKERSDLEDEGIKGKVRSIEYETESLRTSQTNKRRQITRVDEFTLSGNNYSTSWFRDGEMHLRNSFGYIDGFRVCKSYGDAGSQIDKLSYEYKDGKIAKETTITGNGLVVTTTYTYINGGKEVRLYDQNEKLTERLVFKYDVDGNETVIDIFETTDDTNRIKVSIRFTYHAFDPVGNWTQRSSSSAAKGGDKYVPLDTVYRTIAYYDVYNPTWFAPINDPKKPD